MHKQAQTLPTMKMLEQVLGQTLARKTATSFDSVSTTERDPNVSDKLKLTGEGYTQATESEFGKQVTEDLVNQGPNTGPLPDKASSEQPEDRSSFNDTKSNPLYDVFHVPEEPTEKRTDPDPNVSDKLTLKKDAAAVMAAIQKQAAAGNELIEYMMRYIVPQQANGQKQASTQPQQAVTEEEILNDVSKLASVDAQAQVKTAMVHFLDDALYAADAVAFELASAQAEMEKQAQAPQAQAPRFQGFFPKTAEELPPEMAAGGELPPEMAAEGMGDMSNPDPGMDDGVAGGEGDLSEEEAAALMEQSLAENGVDPATLEGGEGGMEGVEGDMGGGEDIDPEMIEFLGQLEEAGISPDEAIEAIMEIQAEEEQGIPAEAGAEADIEAAKTGHYKFASFIQRPVTKTAEQEQRAANVRCAVRDFLYGPGTRNFN